MTQRRDRRGWPARGLHRLALAALAVATTAVPTIAVAGAGAAPAPASAVHYGLQHPGLQHPAAAGSPGPRADHPGPRPVDVHRRHPGQGGRGRRRTGAPREGPPAVRHPLQARHLRHRRQPAQLPGRLLHRRRGLRQSPATSSSTAPSTCATSAAAGSCIALNNFWRSLSNLTVNVTTPDSVAQRKFWAVSQAAPLRRVHIKGLTTLMDYCTGPSFASGGFIADSTFDGSSSTAPSSSSSPEQHGGQLDQRRLEPGLLRHRRRARRVLPRLVGVQRLHDRQHDVGEP